jgi:hypothetical protein
VRKPPRNFSGFSGAGLRGTERFRLQQKRKPPLTFLKELV